MKGPFKWGKKSLLHLDNVHPDMVKVVNDALTLYSTVDVGIISSIRTIEEQRAKVDAGVSQTMRSRHIAAIPTQEAAFLYPRDETDTKERAVSHAIDIMAYADGKGTWEDDYYFAFAEAMRVSAVKNGVAIVWGGSWSSLIQVPSIKTAIDDYVAQCNTRKRKPFFDLGHYELASSVYPANYINEPT